MIPTRREHESVEIDLGPHGTFIVRVGWDDRGMPCDVFLYGKKPGDPMNYILQELGIAASKTLQRCAPYYRPRRNWWRVLVSKVLQGKDV